MPSATYSPLHNEGSNPRPFDTQQDQNHLNNSINDNKNNIYRRQEENPGTPITDTSAQLDLLITNVDQTRITDNSSSYLNSSPRPHPSSTTRSTNTKYTALRPTSVQTLELYDDDPDASNPETSDVDDLDFYHSEVRLTLDTPRRDRRFKFNIALCGLLTAAVAVVFFGILYVFVILPSHKGQILTPGGQPSAASLQHLGENVAITNCGRVRGTFEQEAHVFRGIPYAAPPVASLRWRAPVPLTYDSGNCWQDVLNATSYGRMCLQHDIQENAQLDSERKLVGSEDCLFLNVWTPSLNPSEPMPVLVWIHSGDFVYGSGHARGMTPTSELAKTTNAVYVSFNYRLGVFGFLALDALRESGELPHGPTGNYGIMDQQLALKWVKDNIRHFGGDPHKVTVFGHGSGATSIEALLLSPASHGLFSRAWLSSPVSLLNKTQVEACADNEVLMTNSKCSDSNCLRRLDAETLVNLSPWSLDPYWTFDQLLNAPGHTQLRNDLAIFDGGRNGHVIHWNSIKNGPSGPTVPVVLGATYADVYGLKTNLPVTNMTWTDLNTVLVHEFAPLGTDTVVQIKSLYSQDAKTGYSVLDSSTSVKDGLFPLPYQQLARFVRDIQAVCPVKTLSDTLQSIYVNSAPVYLYVAESFPSHKLQPSTSGSYTSPTHNLFVGWDMVSFFGTYNDFKFHEQQGDISFQDIIRQELLSLARTGKPNAARWKAGSTNAGIVRSDVTVYPAPASYFNSCDIFKQLGFFLYTWS